MYITAQGCRLQNDLLCVEWGVKLYYTIPYHTQSSPVLLQCQVLDLNVLAENDSATDFKPALLLLVPINIFTVLTLLARH